MRTAIVYAPDGAVTGLRQDWTFDDMYTAFAMTGLQAEKKGQYTRAELQPLAKENIESLKDFGYFTYARIDGKRRQSDAFAAPVDYWLDYDSEATELTLFHVAIQRTDCGETACHRNIRSGIFY
jgi:ABC-type uncharacterized transport system substrate-binding protein